MRVVNFLLFPFFFLVAACGMYASQPVDSSVKRPYFEVHDALFSLQACKESEILTKVTLGYRELQRLEETIEDRFGSSNFRALKDESNMRFATVMIEQCAGSKGVARLQGALKSLDLALKAK